MSRAGFYRVIASEQQRVLREFRVDFRDGERPEYEVRAEIAARRREIAAFRRKNRHWPAQRH